MEKNKKEYKDKEHLENKRQEFSVEIRRKLRNNILDSKRDMHSSESKDQIEEQKQDDLNQQQQQQQQFQQNQQQPLLNYSQYRQLSNEQLQNLPNDQNFIDIIDQSIQKYGLFPKSNQKTDATQIKEIEDIIQQCLKIVKIKQNQLMLEKALNFIQLVTEYNTCDKYSRFISYVVTNNISPILYQTFYEINLPTIQEYVIQVMVNILQGTTRQTQHIIDYKYEKNGVTGLELFKNLLKLSMDTNNLKALKLVIFGIGNIIGTKQQYRDYYVRNGFFMQIIEIMKNLNFKDEFQFEIAMQCAWCLCSLTREEAPAECVFQLETVSDMIKIFDYSNDSNFICDMVWSLQQIISFHLKAENGGPDNSHVIKYLLDSQILNVIQKSIFNVNMPIIQAGLRLYTSLMKGEIQISVNVVQETKTTILPRILKLIEHTMRNIRIEALKIVTLLSSLPDINVSDHISETFIQKVIMRYTKDDNAVQKECLRSLKNILINISDKQVFLLTNQDLQLIIKDNLEWNNQSEMIIYALDIVKNMVIFYKTSHTLQLGGRYKKIRKIMEQNNIFNLVEKLTDHPNTDVYNSCVEVLQEYQTNEDNQIDEDDNYGLYSNGEGIQTE